MATAFCLITRGGYNWSDRYPCIVESALKNRHKHFVIGGEAVVLGVDGVADFIAPHSRRHDHAVQLYALDIMAARSPAGLHLRCRVRARRDRPPIPAACRTGLEGIVSKHRKRPYQAGTSKHWIKVKNQTIPRWSGPDTFR